MDLSKILGHLENSTELIKQIELEVGRDFVPRTDFNAKNTELKNLEKQVGDLNLNITSLSKEKESFDKTLADLNDEVKMYKLRDMKIRVAREKGIPYEMADRLTGEDEKALTADAESLSKLISTVSKPTAPRHSNQPSRRATAKTARIKRYLQISKENKKKMALNKSTLFDPTLVGDLINKVQGESSLAKMSRQIPIAFNGNKEFTFTMDKEIDVVAESGAKSHGGVTVAPVTIIPIKVEYGARVSDEFMYAAEEEQINILKAFNDGFAKKVARGMDLMAFHGVNPRTGLASSVIGTNNFASTVSQTVAYNEASPDADGNIESAVAQIRAAGYGVNGLIMSPAFSSALSTTLASANGPRKYPELAWGANPQTINGLRTDINKTVSDMTNDTGRAILGDFANAFKWGYAKTIPLEIIQYGNPDNDSEAGDLKGHNQVYLRCELYLGWGILDGTAFSRIVTEAPASGLTLTLSKADTLVGGTKVAVAPNLGANNEYLLKKNGTIPRVNTVVVDTEDGWADYTENAEIAAIEGETIAVVEVVAATGKVVKGGTKVVAAANLKS